MKIHDCMMEAFDEILERMAFMYFEELEDKSNTEGTDQYDYVTEISFSGAITGKFNLFINENHGKLIARNLLGIRDEDTLLEGTIDDAICEFTNMIIGRTMTLINSNRKFDLGIPFITELSEKSTNEEDTLQVKGLLEEYPCMLLLKYRFW
ncbi:MAG: chemotaxis protein CheX [Nitrospinae bacterium]|nr:chemotaxis protein CheX [Nitrospinota bacterium]